MNCLGSLNGIGRSCANNLAGIDEVYVANFDSVKPTASTATMKLTGIEAVGDVAKPFYTFQLEEQVGSLTSTLTKAAGGIHYYTHEVNVQFNKLSADKHLEMQAISKGACVVVVKDNNGKYWYCGYDKYLSGEDTVAQAGQSFDDLNGYTSVLRGRSATMPFEIEGEILTAFKALVNAAPEVAE